MRTWEGNELKDNRAFANPANSADPSGSQAAEEKYQKEKSILQTLRERAENRGLDEQSKATAQKALAQMRQIQRRRIPR